MIPWENIIFVCCVFLSEYTNHGSHKACNKSSWFCVKWEFAFTITYELRQSYVQQQFAWMVFSNWKIENLTP